MNKLLKILLVTVMCASLLMLFGCKNDAGNSANGGQTQGTQNQDDQDVGNDVTQNPEGDATDATGDGNESTEPPVGIEDPEQETAEDDFEIDFGDLTGN